jgi:hypothetical protein
MSFKLSSIGVYNLQVKGSRKNLPSIGTQSTTSMTLCKTPINSNKTLKCLLSPVSKSSPVGSEIKKVRLLKRANFNLNSPVKGNDKSKLNTLKEKLKKYKFKKDFPMNYKILDKEEPKLASPREDIHDEFTAFKVGDEIELIKNNLIYKKPISEKNIVSRLSNNLNRPMRLSILLPEEERTIRVVEDLKILELGDSKRKRNQRNYSNASLSKCYYKTVCCNDLRFDVSKRNFKDKRFILPSVHNLF